MAFVWFLIIGARSPCPAPTGCEPNRGAREPVVLQAVRTRVGCRAEDHVARTVEDLIRRGSAEMPGGHGALLVVFGSSTDNPMALEPADATAEQDDSELRDMSRHAVDL